MEFSTLKLIHIISTVLFLVLYLLKTILLVANKTEGLKTVTKIAKVPEMIISTVFLVTGIWMFVEVGAIKTLQIIKLIAVVASIPLAIVAFKKGNKVLAIVAFFLIVMSYGLAEMAKKKPYPSKSVEVPTAGAEANPIDFGGAVYKANCTMCHGEDGKKGLAGALDLSMSQLDKAGIVAVVNNGRGSMAGYKSTLGEKEVDAVAEYIATLRK